MKTLKWMMAFAAFAVAAVSCGQKKAEAPQKKVLVIYYSQTSNTKKVAQEIATKTGADVEEIVAVNPYNGDFQATIGRCQQEREQGITPEINPIKANLADYDTIFIGYPVWFGTYAPPVAAFLKHVDLSGKKIVPFCTFGSGGLDSSVKDLAKAQPNAEILPGYGVRAARLAAAPQEVDQFLKANGFIEGEFTKLDDFSEPQPATEELSAIFDKAVGEIFEAKDLEEAVYIASLVAEEDDIVLFSPASHSENRRENFEKRGNRFVESVKALENERHQ